LAFIVKKLREASLLKDKAHEKGEKMMITEHQVVIQSPVSSQEGVFETIAELAVQNGIATDTNPVVAGLKQRESQSTTGFQEGFAIPHTKSEAITQPAIIVVRTETKIEWDAFDGQPAFFFISLLIPEAEAGTTHLQALSALSGALMDEKVRQALLRAQSTKEIAALIHKVIKGDGE
jgi:PTS system fructose-specific IIA component